MTQLDPRLNAYREDLAAASLQDRIRAPRYAEGELRQVSAPAAPIRIAPRFDAPLATEALCGEVLTVYEFREGWAWVQLHDDGYVGYTPMDCLSAVIEENSYRVSARLTYLYPAPDIRRPPITKLSFSCTVAPIGVLEGRFVEVLRGGFIFSDHLVGIRERAKDYVRVAERFVGVPYLWGGKTSLGIDCSGLVQISLRAAGVPCMRDSDMQMQSAGEPMDPSNLDAIQRGDLLFWKGHVAIVQSQDWMVHASGQHMEVVVEPLRRAIERINETHGPVMAILRPPVAQQAAAQQRVASAGEKPAIAAQKPAPAEPAAPSKAPAQQPAPPQVQVAALAPKPAAPVTPPPQPAAAAAQPPTPPAIQPAAAKPAVTPQAGSGPAPAAAQTQRPASPPAAAKPQGAQQSGPGLAASSQTAAAQPQKPPAVHPATAAKPAVTQPAPAASAQAAAAQPQKQASPFSAAVKPPSAPPLGTRPSAGAQPAAVQLQKPASPGQAAGKPSGAPPAAAAPQRPSLASVNARPPGAPPPGAPAGPKGQAPIDAKSLAAQIRASMLAAQEARGEEPAESGWNQGPGAKPGDKPDRTG